MASMNRRVLGVLLVAAGVVLFGQDVLTRGAEKNNGGPAASPTVKKGGRQDGRGTSTPAAQRTRVGQQGGSQSGQCGQQGDSQNGQAGQQGDNQNGQAGQQGDTQNAQAGQQGDTPNAQAGKQGDTRSVQPGGQNSRQGRRGGEPRSVVKAATKPAK